MFAGLLLVGRRTETMRGIAIGGRPLVPGLMFSRNVSDETMATIGQAGWFRTGDASGLFAKGVRVKAIQVIEN